MKRYEWIFTAACLCLFAQNIWAEVARRTVAVLDFEAVGVSELECEVIVERFRAELSRTERFLVIDKRQMSSVVEATKDVTVLGRQLGVERVLVGSVSKIGTTFSVVVNLIDTESGQTVKTVIEDHQGSIDVLLQTVIKRAAERLADYEGTGYLAFVGPREGDTIDRLTVQIDGRTLAAFPRADFLLLSQVPEGVHTLVLEWRRPGINGRHPPYTVHIRPGQVVTVETNAIRYKPTLRVSLPVDAMSIDEWHAFYWPELYPEKNYVRGHPSSVAEVRLKEAW